MLKPEFEVPMDTAQQIVKAKKVKIKYALKIIKKQCLLNPNCIAVKTL